jgi:DNA-binding NtrC family response regulator
MAPATQAKLLRVLQDKEFTRVGGTRPMKADVRIVAATHRDLETEIAAGRFRDDLFFRLNVIRIAMPPLRERPDDVEALAVHFAAEFARELGRTERRLSAAALARLRAHRWPGNVRELRNVIERAVLLADGERIEAADVEVSEAPELPVANESGERALSMRDAERNLVLSALRRSGFVQKDAAALLGVSRRKLNYMVQRMGIRHPSWRRNRPEPDGVPAEEPAELEAG